MAHIYRARLYIANTIAEAAVTEIVALHNISPRCGFVLATENEIRSAVRGAVENTLGGSAWLRLPPEVEGFFDGVYVGADDEPAAPQVIGADSLRALGGAAAHQKESAESGAPHVSPAVQP